MAQPRNMDQLVASIHLTHGEHPNSVIPTEATRSMVELPSSTRAVLNGAYAQLVAANNGIVNLAPGAQITTVSQTDHHYITSDRTGTFDRLVMIAQGLSRRNR